MPYASVLFRPRSHEAICAVAKHFDLGHRHPMLDSSPEAKHRFQALKNYIRLHGQVPAPCVLMFEIDGHAILDDHHRIAALAAFQDASALTLDTWIGA